MSLSKSIFSLLITIFLTGCGSKRQVFTSYSETPLFIKAFLDSKSPEGKFLIAEKGQEWNSGCIHFKSEPSCQFISASMDSYQYDLNFWGGGIAGAHKRHLTVYFEKKKVISYSVTDEFSNYNFVRIKD